MKWFIELKEDFPEDLEIIINGGMSHSIDQVKNHLE